MKYGVFVSYSHEDAHLVSPIVKLITANRKDLVFYDNKDITPGKLWEPQILSALKEANLIIIFWCKHASKSAYIKKEYQFGIKLKKDILPLLLDNTQLVESLSKYEWIDFRKTISHEERAFKNLVFTTGLGCIEKLLILILIILVFNGIASSLFILRSLLLLLAFIIILKSILYLTESDNSKVKNIYIRFRKREREGANFTSSKGGIDNLLDLSADLIALAIIKMLDEKIPPSI